MAFSKIVSRSLDYFGYNYDMVKYRVHMYTEMDTKANMLNYDANVQIIRAGSKGEGLTSLFESDRDIMYVPAWAICSDNTQPFTNSRHLTVFKTDRHESPPGYTQLGLVKLGDNEYTDICYLLVPSENGIPYLSSEFIVKGMRGALLDEYATERAQNRVNLLEPSGPSTPLLFSEPVMSCDVVWSFGCYCPSLLLSWITRPRYHGWPTLNILNNISQMEAHVVPVGFKMSYTSHIEWRICFTKAEIHLIHSFNDTQTKVYILLKMVAKNIIKPVCRGITSYIMKNVVFWMSEYSGLDCFTEESLIEIFLQSLQFLKLCVAFNYLPNFMIPERNLLAGIYCLHRQKIGTLLSGLIHEGGALLMRCEKLRDGIVLLHNKPEVAIANGEKRDMVEKLELMRQCVRGAKETGATTKEELDRLCDEDEGYREIVATIYNILVPEWPVLLLMGTNITLVANHRLREVLS